MVLVFGKAQRLALIIGAGSIGLRHAALLDRMGFSIHFVTQRKDLSFLTYSSIESAVQENRYDYIIIANETAKHYQTLRALSHQAYSGAVLVEKPLFHKYMDLKSLPFPVYVGYHLRFHPLLQRLKSVIEHEPVLSVHAYVGQYLPSWRKDRPYHECYCAKKSEGGGVLRDLSHELDYLCWLLGPVQACGALMGNDGSLNIETEEVAGILLACQRCPVVSLQMNYYDRTPRRELIFNARDHTYKIDFIHGLWSDGDEHSVLNRDYNQPYIDMHQAILNAQGKEVCSFEEGLSIVQLIERLEVSCVS